MIQWYTHWTEARLPWCKHTCSSLPSGCCVAIHFVWKALLDPMDLGFKRILQKWFQVLEWTTGMTLELWSPSLVFFVAFVHPTKDVTCSSISCWMHLLVHVVLHLQLEVHGGALPWWSGPLPSSCVSSLLLPHEDAPRNKPTVKKKKAKKDPEKIPNSYFFRVEKEKGVAHRWSPFGRASSPHTRRAHRKRATQAEGGAGPWHV